MNKIMSSYTRVCSSTDNVCSAGKRVVARSIAHKLLWVTKFARGKIGTIIWDVSAICIGRIFIYIFIYIDFTGLRGIRVSWLSGMFVAGGSLFAQIKCARLVSQSDALYLSWTNFVIVNILLCMSTQILTFGELWRSSCTF